MAGLIPPATALHWEWDRSVEKGIIVARRIWFKTYSADYLIDKKIDETPWEARGLLWSIWCVLHQEGRLSSDPKEIARKIRAPLEIVQMHMQTLMQFLHKDAEGLLYSKRLDDEIERGEHISIVRTAAAKVRHSKELPANASAKEPANGHAKLVHSESESELNTPLTPQGGKPKRRTRQQIISEFGEGTKQVVNPIIQIWPKIRPGNQSAIAPDVPLLASRVDEILHSTPSVTPELLLAGAKLYLAEQKQFPHAPEFFFGPGKNGEPPWKAYARMAYHQQRQVAQ